MNKIEFILLLAVLYIFTVGLTSLKQRHDFVKYYTNNLDDKAVKWGIISDDKLHKLGNKFGLCGERPGDL